MYISQSIISKDIIVKKELQYKNAVVGSYEIHYPQFEANIYIKNIEKINQYYKLKVKQHQFYCEHKLYQDAISQYIDGIMPNYKFEFLVTYNISYNQNCAISLYFDQYEFVGGAHGNTIRTADSWCLIHGNKIKLENLFYDTTYYNYIYEQIESQIKDQLQIDSGLYFPEYKKLIKENFNINNFYFTMEGVTIYFQLYELAPYVAGFLQFLIYYKASGPKEPSCITI